MTTNFQVKITDGGRSGSIIYQEEGGGEYSTWWELAIGEGVLAFMAVTTPENWDRQVPWAVGRREEILTRIATEVVRQKSSGCSYDIGDGFVEFLRTGARR